MTLDRQILDRQTRETAIASIRRFADDQLDQPLGALQAGLLLDFMLEEIGPVVFNQAVASVQQRLAQQIEDLPFEVHQDEFPYWRTGSGRSR